MVSVHCNYTVINRLPRLSRIAEATLPCFFRPTRLHRYRRIPSPITAVKDNPFGADALDGHPSPRTLFPGGFKRPEIKIPSLAVRVSAEEVLRMDNVGVSLGEAVLRGVSIVVLDVGKESGGHAYKSACMLKSLVGDMAYLLIAERVDIATAAGADGVVLSDQDRDSRSTNCKDRGAHSSTF